MGKKIVEGAMNEVVVAGYGLVNVGTSKNPVLQKHSASGNVIMPYNAENKFGRNVPCPCSSGKKYKNCCGK